ncbi:MAG TPA: 2-dehydropantoate 2-reductase [Pseudomonadota bacterium]|nr:2-dehydropantoate 2-reductase [Pseudomonadota bacterium]
MKLGVFGAGSIGCYLGGRLIAAGWEVTLVGRLGSEVRAHGLTLTDYTGARTELAPAQVRYVDDARALADCDVVLVTVKGTATAEAGAALAPVVKPGAVVVSFQNGVTNADRLRVALPGRTLLAGMVPFNVVNKGSGHFHNGTSGPLELERGSRSAAELQRVLQQAGFSVVLHGDLRAVQWSKLLINLNNAVNALAGVPLREQLADRGYRLVMADIVREGLSCLRAAGIRPVRLGRLIPSLAPTVLALPDWLFFRVAAAMVKVDPAARSSMWEDLDRRRLTEIELLNGEIIRLGEKHGVATPLNRKLYDLIRSAERDRRGSPQLSAQALRAALA